MSYNSKYTGQRVEELLDQVANGNVGGDVTASGDIYVLDYTDRRESLSLEEVDKISNAALVVIKDGNFKYVECFRQKVFTTVMVRAFYISSVIEYTIGITFDTTTGEVIDFGTQENYMLNYPQDNEIEDLSKTIYPNKYYVWGEVSSLDITLLNYQDDSFAQEFLFQFTSGATPTTLSIDANIQWANGIEPIPKSNKTYQISIVNGLGTFLEF